MQIVKPLTGGEIEKINETSEDILENLGLHVEHTELLSRLKAGGARVNETTGNVRIPTTLLRELLAKIPAKHTICQIDGTEDVVEIGSEFFLGSIVLPRVMDIAKIISDTQGIKMSKLITSSCPISTPLTVHPFYA